MCYIASNSLDSFIHNLAKTPATHQSQIQLMVKYLTLNSVSHRKDTCDDHSSYVATELAKMSPTFSLSALTKTPVVTPSCAPSSAGTSSDPQLRCISICSTSYL